MSKKLTKIIAILATVLSTVAILGFVTNYNQGGTVYAASTISAASDTDTSTVKQKLQSLVGGGSVKLLSTNSSSTQKRSGKFVVSNNYIPNYAFNTDLHGDDYYYSGNYSIKVTGTWSDGSAIKFDSSGSQQITCTGHYVRVSGRDNGQWWDDYYDYPVLCVTKLDGDTVYAYLTAYESYDYYGDVNAQEDYYYNFIEENSNAIWRRDIYDVPSCTINFNIPYSIKECTISDVQAQTYTGSQIKPEPTVTLDGTTLTKDTDYTLSYGTNIDVGTGTVTITGKGDYTGSVTKEFDIVGISITGATCTISNTYTYDGYEKKPEPTVKYGTKTLVKGTDYNIKEYGNNINASTSSAYVTLEGIGNYSSTKRVYFGINKKSIANAYSITTPTALTYNGNSRTPTLYVRDYIAGTYTTLSNGTHYSLSYSTIKEPNNYTITITGTGNYTGSTTKTQTVNKAYISSVSIGSISSYTYDGTAKQPTPTISIGGTTLVKDTDYTLSWSNNTNKGTGTLTITAKNTNRFYSGSTTKDFTINAQNVSSSGVSVEYTQNNTFSNLGIKPSFVIKQT